MYVLTFSYFLLSVGGTSSFLMGNGSYAHVLGAGTVDLKLKYFITLIDDSTRFCYIYLLKSKDEALHYFKIYKTKVENQFERKIKRVRSDRGG
jgi:hypothetical protein